MPIVKMGIERIFLVLQEDLIFFFYGSVWFCQSLVVRGGSSLEVLSVNRCSWLGLDFDLGPSLCWEKVIVFLGYLQCY